MRSMIFRFLKPKKVTPIHITKSAGLMFMEYVLRQDKIELALPSLQ